MWLVSSDSSGNPLVFEDHASYGAAGGGEALGRWPNGSGDLYPMSSATSDAANSGPLVPAAGTAGGTQYSGSLVISEVMYDPPDPASGLAGQQCEYVMITNISTTTAVTLTNWRLRNAVSFNFPSGQVLAAGASLLVVPFDPVNSPDALSRFEARYSGFASSQLVIDGPYSGALNNGGDTLDLEQPGTPLPSDPTSTPHLIEDEVAYSNVAPWPTAAYGGGDSLQRNLATIGWGDLSTSWTAAPPTLGLLETPPVGNVDVYTTSGNPITAAAGVLANDTGNSSLSALLVSYPAYGGLAFAASNGSFTYTPYFGQHPDSFQYQADDGTLLSHTVTVLINPPLAASYSFTVNTKLNPTLTVAASAGVLSNDSDPSGYHLQAELITPPADGSLTLNGDGSFTYVPNAGYSGPDSFTYAANDGVVDSAVATVSITVISPPTVVTPASATPSPVSGTTANLSVLGGDSAGESTLTYTWAVTTLPSGAAQPTFSANGTHAAQDSTVTFSEAGNYTFQVTITDPSNRTATSSVNVSVNQTLTAIAISPLFATLNAGTAQQFTATANDQFGNALMPQPTFTWTTNVAGGSINSGSGLFASPNTTAIGTVTAASGAFSGYSTVIVTDHAPTVAAAASATPGPAPVTTAALAVLGADVDTPESSLTYTWTATTVPGGAAQPTFSANGTHAAQEQHRHFQQGGQLHLPGHDHRSGRPDGYEQREREREPDADRDYDEPPLGQPQCGVHAAVHGYGERPVRPGSDDAAHVDVVRGRRRHCQQRALRASGCEWFSHGEGGQRPPGRVGRRDVLGASPVVLQQRRFLEHRRGLGK